MFGDTDYWLTKKEQEQTCAMLFQNGVIEYDTDRGILLSSGGTTDIHLRMEDLDDHPELFRYLTKKYASPLQRMEATRFIEVLGGMHTQLSMKTGIPYLTTHDGTEVEGAISVNDNICLVDGDVLNGASIGRLWKNLMNGLTDEISVSAVALLDRQAGWQKYFADNGIDADIWFGMTLHQLRKWLISNGHMVRCEPAREEKNPIIVALDGKSWEEALAIAEMIRGTGCILKVNDLAFLLGMQLIHELEVYGDIMWDIKINDISNTGINIAEKLVDYAPWAVTMHATAGAKTIKAVVDTLASVKTHIVVVTVLTSIDKVTCKEIYRRLPLTQVLVLAKLAHEAGATGFVCSPAEAPYLRALYPNSLIVTPGVRSPQTDIKGDDQDPNRKRTPAEALEFADNVVMGRQLLTDPDIIAEIMRVCEEELALGIF